MSTPSSLSLTSASGKANDRSLLTQVIVPLGCDFPIGDAVSDLPFSWLCGKTLVHDFILLRFDTSSEQYQIAVTRNHNPVKKTIRAYPLGNSSASYNQSLRVNYEDLALT